MWWAPTTCSSPQSAIPRVLPGRRSKPTRWLHETSLCFIIVRFVMRHLQIACRNPSAVLVSSPNAFFLGLLFSKIRSFIHISLCSYYTVNRNTNNRFAMSRFLFSVFLCSVAQSLAIIPHGVEDALTEISPDTPAQCAHNADTEYAVISWPNDSW